MAITQAEFDKRFQEVLSTEGFELNLRDTRELLELLSSTIQGALAEQTPKPTTAKRRRRAASADANGAKPAVTVRGLGKYSIRYLPKREGRNPGTGETIQIEASSKMKVLAPKPMRDALGVK